MGHQVIMNKDGKFNVFSSISDGWLFYEPCTEQQLINWLVDKAAEKAKADIEVDLEKIKKGNARGVYRQFTMDWNEADKLSNKTARDNNLIDKSLSRKHTP